MSEVGSYVSEKINVSKLRLENYISTDNMISNRGGISLATKLPSVKTTTAFQKGDILISNIRPYFKKIWLADKSGGCSNDVLVIRSDSNFSNRFLYYVLSSDTFFDYAVSTSKGTKMPRGDKSSIMKYTVPLFSLEEQELISDILKSYDEKIQLNKRINHHLEQMAQAIFKSWFIDFEPFKGKIPEEWEYVSLSEVSKLSAGGDKPLIVSDKKSGSLNIPIFSNSISNYGLYGYTNKAQIFEEAVTVSARGTVGNVNLRVSPYVPIVRLISVIPNKNYLSAKYLYYYLKSIPISGVGTTQQQLTVPDFGRYSILLPSKQVVNDFTTKVQVLLNEMICNEKENVKLSQIRDSLLPKLLSGELVVSQTAK